MTLILTIFILVQFRWPRRVGVAGQQEQQPGTPFS